MTCSRFTGLDLHKQFIEATTPDRQGKVVTQWRFPTTPEAIREFAETLSKEDAVVLEDVSSRPIDDGLLASGGCRPAKRRNRCLSL